MPPKRPSSPANGSSSNGTAKSPATAASRDRRAGVSSSNDAELDERGEFEDAWEDEFEEEEIESGDDDADEDSETEATMGKNRVTGMEDDVDGQSGAYPHRLSLMLIDLLQICGCSHGHRERRQGTARKGRQPDSLPPRAWAGRQAWRGRGACSRHVLWVCLCM